MRVIFFIVAFSVSLSNYPAAKANEAWEQMINLLEAANKQCNGVSEATEPAVKLAAAQTCREAFTELDKMALNCCIGWVEAKCRRIQGSTDARYQCTVKMPLCPLQDLLQVPKTLRDCAYTTLAEAWIRRKRSRQSRSSTAGSSSSGQQVQQSSGSGRKRQRQNTDGASGSGSAGASGSRSTRPPSPPRFVHRPLSPTPENPPIPGSGSAGPSGSRPARTPSFSFLDDLLPPTPEDSVSIPHDNTLISDPSYSVDAFLSEDPSRFGGLPYSVVDPFSRPTSPPRYSPVSPSDLFRGSFSLPSTPEHLGAPADPPPGHVLDEGFGVDDFSDDDALLYLEGGPAEQVAEGGDNTGQGGERWYCQEPGCTSSFGNKLWLDRHMRHHEMRRRGELTCKQCDPPRDFQYPWSLQKHVKKHHAPPGAGGPSRGGSSSRGGGSSRGVGSSRVGSSQAGDGGVNDVDEQGGAFKCTEPECKKSYKSEASLRRHLRDHAAVRTGDTKCSQCSYKGTSVQNLKGHMRRRHGMEPPTRPKPFPCDKCERGYSTAGQLFEHKKSHEGKATCKYCGGEFSKPVHMYNHVRKAHPDKPDPLYGDTEIEQGQ